LWEVILDDVLAIPFLLDGDCESIDFYFFAIVHRAWNAIKAERASYGERWKTLRSVCRRWKAIVDRQSKTWIQLQSSSTVWEIPPEARRVDILLSIPSPIDDVTVSPEDGFGNVQVLSLSEIWSHSIPEVPPSSLAALNRALDVIGSLKHSIHSVIYETYVNVGPDHLQALNRAFPLMTSLTLHATEISGTLSLPNLKVLWISAGTFDISRWNLPSLKHLALGDQDAPDWTIHYESLQLGPIKKQILSLLKFYPYRVLLTPSFWASHSSLEFFGAPSLLLNQKGACPYTHKARIFCITGPRIDNLNSPRDGSSLHLPQFPHLTTFITPHKKLHTRRRSNDATFSAMLRYCEDNNIAWYMGYKQKVEPPAKGNGSFVNMFG
ncbi:hypothetical protein FRC17_010112, partial [Serendipita sp. 399]